MPTNQPLNVFISYSNSEEDKRILLELKKYLSFHVRKNKIVIWDDGLIMPGSQWDTVIKEKLRRADIVLLLISADFNNSDYIQDTELPIAFEREKQKECEIVPILARNCYYKGEEYANLKMIPQMSEMGKSLEPLTSSKWDSEADAFTKVVEQLDKVFQAISALKNTPFSFIPSGIIYSIESIWQEIPLIEELGLKITVNCDRDTEYTKTLFVDFDEKVNLDRNLYYFICGCESQNPESIAKRLVYEFEEEFATCWCGNEIVIERLEIKPKVEGTWRNFWRVFNKSLAQNFTDFDHFAEQSPIFLEQYMRIPLFCTIKENYWTSTPKLESHLQYVIERFASLPAGCHKFVFFFIFEFDGFHNLFANDEIQHLRYWQRLDQIITPDGYPYVKPHIRQIRLENTVSEEDVKIWFKSIVDKNRTGHKTVADYVDLLFNILLRELREEEITLYQSNKRFNMSRIETIQRAAYQHWNNFKS